MKKKWFQTNHGHLFACIEKFLKIMKIIIFIIAFSAIQTFALDNYAQTKRMDVKIEQSTIVSALEIIEAQSDFFFFYNNKVIKLDKKVSVDLKNKSINEILDVLFKDTDIEYTINNRQIILSGKETGSLLSQQSKKITGKVTDLTGSSLPGVSVVVKGTTTGVITDTNGIYTLANIPENATLQFSFVGMKSQEIAVGNKTTIDVLLAAESIGLEEVVAVGYGVQKKKLVTGATIQISGDNIQKMNTVSPLTAMQSQSPGVSITKYSGKPGSDFKINIRGLGTIGSSNPLIIIDDVAGGDLNLINPSDIESIDVLKDAASAAIYGARAANGVILIKTKQGSKGKNKISYDGYYGVQNVAKYVDVLNAPQYIDLQNESYKNIGAPIPDWAAKVPEYNRIQQGWKGTDWQREFTNKNAPVQNHALGLTGGGDLSKYSLGISYTGQEGIYGQPEAPNYQRYSFRLNSEYAILKNSSFDVIKIGENLLYNFVNQQHGNLAADGIYYNDTRYATNMHPLMSVYDENGNFTKQIPFADLGNPIGSYHFQRSGSESKRHNLRANAYLEIQPIKGLVFRSNFGYQLNADLNRSYVPTFDLGGRNVETVDVVDQSLSTGIGYQLENTLNYKLSIKETHNLDILVGQSIDKSGLGESMYGRNRGSIFDTFEYAYLSNVKSLNPSNVVLNGTPWGKNIISSYFGRVNYDYKETYMASIIMRADGSSNFAKGKQWGYFPSVAAGWILSNESFMKSTSNVLDYLKIRASWGRNGNQNIIPFQYLSTYSFSEGDYYFGPEKDSYKTGAYPSILPNKDVTWETSEQLNIGIDSRFFKSRLGINIDWYNKTTKDWLVQAPVPTVWGAAAPYINGGNVENKGFEFVFSWNDKVGELKYGINANVAFNKNNVTYIANTEGIIEGDGEVLSGSDRTPLYRAQVGYPISYFYGYKTEGVFQNQAQIDAYTSAKLAGTRPGDLIIVDTDKSGVIDSKDKTMIGDPNPDAIFGFSFNLGYKGFDFSLSANGVAGNQLISSYRDRTEHNWPTQYLGRWHGEGTSNRYPRIDATGNQNWGLNSDVYVENGDFLRIQNITIGYDFKRLFPKIPLSQARFYVAAQNLYTLTGYYGADPEVGYSNNSWSKGIDIGAYPSPRTIMLGLNLKF